MGQNKPITDRPLKKPGPEPRPPEENRSCQVSAWVLPDIFERIEAVRGRLSRSDWILAQIHIGLDATKSAPARKGPARK